MDEMTPKTVRILDHTTHLFVCKMLLPLAEGLTQRQYVDEAVRIARMYLVEAGVEGTEKLIRGAVDTKMTFSGVYVSVTLGSNASEPLVEIVKVEK